MNDYDRQALRGSALALLAALLAYVASFVSRSSADVAAVFGIFAVLALSAYYFLDRPELLAGVWIAPTVAAVLTLASGSPHDQQLTSLALAALSVVGFVAYPLVGYAVRVGENVGDGLR
ncbi:hypothetical protein [Halobacterium wangiae]|uniref:hypothetical protein n=1 Tax=Halobacterium wangiae TaxID=2902623 RepID=UPI001E613B07|nr:hypothetical protein [Halobacterium wangiae]